MQKIQKTIEAYRINSKTCILSNNPTEKKTILHLSNFLPVDSVKL